jgi:hypothetical protein
MPWRVYSNNCPECQIRCIANMDQAARPPIFERIERECGRKALHIVKERVGLEVVRMRLLKDGKRA